MKGASIITAIISGTALILGSLWIIGQHGGFEPPVLGQMETVTVVETVGVPSPCISMVDLGPGCQFELRLQLPTEIVMATHIDWDGDGSSYMRRLKSRRIDGYRSCDGRLVEFVEPRAAMVFYIGGGG